MLRKVMAGTGCLVLHVGVAGVAAGAAPASSPMEDTCSKVLSGDPGGGARKATDPADGSWVSPGDPVSVTITWPSDAFAGEHLHKVLDCVTINGELAAALSREERKPTNDGLFEHRFMIPADARVGTEICDRGMVAGLSVDGPFRRDKTNDVCVTVAGPPSTRVPDEVEQGEEVPPPLEQPGVVSTGPAPLAAPAPVPEFPETGLANTGSAARFLAALAGLQLAVGGIAVMFSAARRRLFGTTVTPETKAGDSCPTEV